MMISSVIMMMLASGSPAQATEKADKLVCKKFAVTGSLVQTRRVCYTRGEWAKMNQRDQDAARKFVDENRGRPPGT